MSEQLLTKSPCIKICTLDDNNVCKGCQRTVEQIIKWKDMSDSEKDQVNRQLLSSFD